MASYPVPTEPPVYQSAPRKVRGRRLPLYELVAACFGGLGLIFSIWLALLLIAGLGSGMWWANVVLFWLVLSYLLLPRLHQIFTLVYVPDYFIGRTKTSQGLLGDPVNLAADGTADDIHACMERAGWTLADPLTARSSLGIVTSTLLRRPYPTAPVSDLMLFGRRQDFAYQQEVGGDAAQRHHVRFWHVPEGWLLPGGHQVGWLAAATFDRRVGLSSFTLQVTHKVDADIDIERDYVINTVRYADACCGVHVIKDFSTSYHAHNGGGDAVQTDGDLPVLDLNGAADRDGWLPVKLSASARHVLPPPSLLITVGWLLSMILVPSVMDAARDGGLVNIGISLGLLAVAGFALARQRWAWLLLMTASALFALVMLAAVSLNDLGYLGDEGRLVDDAGGLLTCSLAVLAMVSVSDQAVRRWVSGGRSEPTLDLDTGNVEVETPGLSGR